MRLIHVIISKLNFKGDVIFYITLKLLSCMLIREKVLDVIRGMRKYLP
jgi:hypothetical protein